MKFDSGFVPAPHEATVTEIFSEDEFVSAVFDERTLKVHRLNPGASAVWVMCDGQQPVVWIIDELVEVFGQDPAVVAATVDEALDLFWQSSLLASSPPPEPDAPIQVPVLPTNVLERLHDP